ncbi:hypothetical protein KUCAC02_032288, partial [Chaenocephalus aceratus]
ALLGDMGNSNGACPSPVRGHVCTTHTHTHTHTHTPVEWRQLRVSPEKQRHVGEGNQEEVETLSEAPQRLPGRFQAQKPREENLKERDNIRARGVSASWSRRQHSPPLNEAPVVVFLLRRLHVHILL